MAYLVGGLVVLCVSLTCALWFAVRGLVRAIEQMKALAGEALATQERLATEAMNRILAGSDLQAYLKVNEKRPERDKRPKKVVQLT